MRTDPLSSTWDNSLTACAPVANGLCPRGTPREFPAGTSLTRKDAPVGDDSVSKVADSRARKVPPREVEQSATVVPRRFDSCPHAVAVEDAERCPKALRRVRPIRVPPRHRHAARVRVDELHARALVEPVLGVRAPEPRLLHAAPRGLPGPVRIGHVVRPHRPGCE